jgi:hypothetical protein
VVSDEPSGPATSTRDGLRMLASSHPEHHAPVEEASNNQRDYAEELPMHTLPEQAQHPP